MQRKARPLRQGRRPALRLHLGLDQVDARVGPRRLALLPRGDARGRRGRALHRAPDGDPRLRGRRQRGPAGARRSPSRRRTRSSTSGCPSASYALAQAAIYLVAGAEVERRQQRRSPPRARTSATTAPPRRPPRCARPPIRARRRSGAGSATTTRTTTPGTSTTRSTCPRGLEDLRFYEPGDDEPRCASGWRRSGASAVRLTPEGPRRPRARSSGADRWPAAPRALRCGLVPSAGALPPARRRGDAR